MCHFTGERTDGNRSTSLEVTGQGFDLEALHRSQLGPILSFPQPGRFRGGTSRLGPGAMPSTFWGFSLGQQGQVRSPEPGAGSQWGIFAVGTSLSFWPGWVVGVCCSEEVSASWCLWGGCVEDFCSVEPLWLLTSLFWLCAEEGFSPEPKH